MKESWVSHRDVLCFIVIVVTIPLLSRSYYLPQDSQIYQTSIKSVRPPIYRSKALGCAAWLIPAMLREPRYLGEDRHATDRGVAP